MIGGGGSAAVRGIGGGDGAGWQWGVLTWKALPRTRPRRAAAPGGRQCGVDLGGGSAGTGKTKVLTEPGADLLLSGTRRGRSCA